MTKRCVSIPKPMRYMQPLQLNLSLAKRSLGPGVQLLFDRFHQDLSDRQVFAIGDLYVWTGAFHYRDWFPQAFDQNTLVGYFRICYVDALISATQQLITKALRREGPAQLGSSNCFDDELIANFLYRISNGANQDCRSVFFSSSN